MNFKNEELIDETINLVSQNAGAITDVRTTHATWRNKCRDWQKIQTSS